MSEFVPCTQENQSGTYKGRTYKGTSELDVLAEKAVDTLRAEGLPIWQAKDVMKRAINLMDWEQLKER